MHLNLGLSLPTGGIEQMDVTPASSPSETLLPYPMQIGSGTFDLLPGATYLWQTKRLSGGAQVAARLPLGTNQNSYSWGNQFQANLWAAYLIHTSLSLSLRVHGNQAGTFSGADERYMMAVNNRMVPTVFTENTGGTQLFAGPGVNFYLPNGVLKNLRLGVEATFPLYRKLNGVQLETDFVINSGIQYSF